MTTNVVTCLQRSRCTKYKRTDLEIWRCAILEVQTLLDSFVFFREAAILFLAVSCDCRPAVFRLLAVERERLAGGVGHFASAIFPAFAIPHGRIQATRRLVDCRGGGIRSKRQYNKQRLRSMRIRLHICVLTYDMSEGIHMHSCMPPWSR